MNIQLVIKGNLICNKTLLFGGGVEYPNDLICDKNIEHYNINESIVIDGDVLIENIIINGIVLVTGEVIVKGVNHANF